MKSRTRKYKQTLQQKELIAIYNKHKILRPKDVVDFARNPNTALHTAFEWDDTEAAEKYRLEQARQVIQVYVEISEVTNKPMRAFVSLRADRTKGGGGYRRMPDVLRSKKYYKQLLDEAKYDAEYFALKYGKLKEVGEILKAIKYFID